MDGYEQPYWNLLQVLAWVYLGDRELVRKFADDVNDHGSIWRDVRVPGAKENEFVEIPNDKPDMGFLAAAASATEPAFADIEGAKNAVLKEVQLGTLIALGLKEDARGPCEIPQDAWAYLKFTDNPPRAVPADRTRSAPTWFNLKFKRTDVLNLWPDPLAEAESPGIASRQQGVQGAAGPPDLQGSKNADLDLIGEEEPRQFGRSDYVEWEERQRVLRSERSLNYKDASAQIATELCGGVDALTVARECRRVRKKREEREKAGSLPADNAL